MTHAKNIQKFPLPQPKQKGIYPANLLSYFINSTFFKSTQILAKFICAFCKKHRQNFKVKKTKNLIQKLSH
jgi:hypothetical protein